MLNIALLGYDAHNDNLGVGALTVSAVQMLRDIALKEQIKLCILIIGKGGERPACVSGPDISERRVRPLARPWELLRVIMECDLVIDISGGDSFSGIYGRRRLAIIFVQKFLAHILRRPVIMAPQTVGPFTGQISRKLAAITIRRSALVATRDDYSTAYVRKLGIDRKVIEASDIALRLPFSAPSKRPLGSAQIGLNVSGLLMQGGYTGDNMFALKADYPVLIRRLIKGFLELEDACEVHLVGHVIAWRGQGQEDDYAACRALAEEFPSVRVAPAFVAPSEAKSFIAGLDFFMGARMHACIAAFSAGVPVVPMAYSRKFAGLFGSLGYEYTVDCTAESTDNIEESIFSAFAHRAQMAREIEEALARGLDRIGAYERALEALMLDLAGGGHGKGAAQARRRHPLANGAIR